MSNTEAPDWVIVNDEQGVPIYKGAPEYCARFKRYRDQCIAAERNSKPWWKAKDKIDHGPGMLIFDGGDIYGSRI